MISMGTYYQGIYYKKQPYYSSAFGGIISIIALGFIISYTTYTLENVFGKVSYNVDENFEPTDLGKYENFTIAHALDVMELSILVRN